MKISVVITVHNHGKYLVECLQSVLDQSYPAYEIVLVGALSDDGYVKECISHIDHPRLNYVSCPENGSHLSALGEKWDTLSGEIVCILDENDKFKVEKLNEVSKYFAANPKENAVCHSCFVLSEFGEILSLWRPKGRISLENLLLQDLMPLSALAIRRSSIPALTSCPEAAPFAVNWIDLVARLLLPNVTLGVIDRPLCDTRIISKLGTTSLSVSLKCSLQILETIFNHPDCPERLLRLRESVFARMRLKLAYEAFVQRDGVLGREMLRSSIYLDRSILDVQAYRFFFFLIVASINYDDHQDRIACVFEQLPPEMMWMAPHMTEVIARGFALRGVRAILWNRVDEGRMDLAEAAKRGCRMDQYFFYALTEELVNYESVSNSEKVVSVLRVLTPYLEKMSTASLVRRFIGEFFANRAFREFDKRRYLVVLRSLQYAISAWPAFLINRGLLAILFRSVGRLRSRVV